MYSDFECFVLFKNHLSLIGLPLDQPGELETFLRDYIENRNYKINVFSTDMIHGFHQMSHDHTSYLRDVL